MDINLKDVQKWYAGKINKQVIELDSYDLFCAKVAYDYACEQFTIMFSGSTYSKCKHLNKKEVYRDYPDSYIEFECLDCGEKIYEDMYNS